MIGYLAFLSLWLVWGNSLHYILILVLSHIIAVTNAFFAYRILVFRKVGSGLLDFFRFNIVYLGALIFNILVLPFLIEILEIHPLLAQAIVLVVTAILSYILHQRFSFKSRLDL